MKKIFNKWENLNIKYKLFSITTALLIALAIIIYFILNSLLPVYYKKYKIEELENSINRLTENSKYKDTEFLKEEISYIAKKNNFSVLIRDQNGRIIDGNSDFILKNYTRFILGNRPKEYIEQYQTTVYLKTNDYYGFYRVDIVMPLQPIDEASDVIRKIMPYIMGIAILIGAIGAYIYSNVITKPLIEIIEKEREAESRRKDFVATISHELKTPITIISGQLEGMIYNIGKYKDRDAYLKKSYESTQELKELVNEMMEISKCEILEKDLYLKKINLSKLLYKLVNRQAFLIEEKNIKTELNIDNDIFIECDEERMTKAINNIINNAIKYSPNNEKLIINLYTKNNKSTKRNIIKKIYVEIENTGTKIDDKYLKEIFKPFFRIEKSRSRKTGGSGLGLYLVNQILNNHGFVHKLSNKENSVVFTIII